MKITKSQLREIIRKEIRNSFINEAKLPYMEMHYTHQSALRSALSYAEDMGYSYNNDAVESKFKKLKAPTDNKSIKTDIMIEKDGDSKPKTLYITITHMGNIKRTRDGVKKAAMHGGQPEYKLKCEIK
jgi:hypothetical protein